MVTSSYRRGMVKKPISMGQVCCPRRRRQRIIVIVLMCLALIGIACVFIMKQRPRFPVKPEKVKNAKKGYFWEEDLSEDEVMHLQRPWKEPTWQAADVLRRTPDVSQSSVPVVVVEEHYEVLKYWFDAVETGLIQGTGNTLLHIDGHSDGAPPRDPWIVPWFRLPANHSEVANMMQSNDVFIAGSALTGLINRYIWIWPEWDRPNHIEDSDHEVLDLIAGWRTFHSSAGKPLRRHCACGRSRPGMSAKDGTWRCWVDKPDAWIHETEGNPADESAKCEVVLTATAEFVHENKALELLRRGDWIKEDESLLLDIDEDYYGCESSVMPLYNAGFRQSSVNYLSRLVGSLFCANDVRSESIADKVFRIMVKIVRDFKANLCADAFFRGIGKCFSDKNSRKILKKLIPKISYGLERAGAGRVLCASASSKVTLQLLIRRLLHFNSTQLDALTFVGVCLESAPTFFLFQPGSMHICHGGNIPGESQVIFHVPAAKENDVRSELLRSTLSLLPQQPKLVTVCRSMRDGYTPWVFFSYIEKAILNALRSVFKGVREESHYDENLLGGKYGWPQRH